VIAMPLSRSVGRRVHKATPRNARPWGPVICLTTSGATEAGKKKQFSAGVGADARR
jgi:hypothetical protein